MDLSTAHIPEVDGMRLAGCIGSTRKVGRVIAQEIEGRGHFLHIGDWSHGEVLGDGLSKDFARLIGKLQRAGFCYLRLDADAPLVEGLRKFKW